MPHSHGESAADENRAGWLPENLAIPQGNSAMLGALFEEHPDMIFVSGAGGRIVGANCRALVEFGYFRRDLEFQPLDLLLSKAAHKRYAGHLRRYMQQPSTSTRGSFLNIKVRDAHGNEFPVDVVLRTCEAGGERYVIAVCRRFDTSMTQSQMQISVPLECSRDDAVNQLDAQGRILTWNEGSRWVYGKTASEAVGQSHSILFTRAEIAAGEPARQLEEASRSTSPARTAGWRTSANGEQIWAEIELTAARNVSGHFNGFVRVLHDLTSLKREEEEMRAAGNANAQLAAALEIRVAERTRELESTVDELRAKNQQIETYAGIVSNDLGEKEVLLREVYHRVKNNLQVVQSLLKMGARSSRSVDSVKCIETAVQRVHVMALVHEHLYQMPDLAGLSLSAYLREVVEGAISANCEQPDQVQLQFDADEIPILMDLAIPMGLMANELVMNCLKHGLPYGTPGKISISARVVAGAVRFVVQDNGVGLPKGFDLKTCASMGIKLAESLAHQLGGQLEFTTSNGCRVQVDLTRLRPQREGPRPSVASAQLAPGLSIGKSETMRGTPKGLSRENPDPSCFLS
jgi:PAS domain S-box-containing protein